MTAAGTTSEALTAVLRAGGGPVGEQVDRALALLLDQFGMQIAYVSVFRDGDRVVTHSRSVPDGPVLPPGTTHPRAETLCHLTATGALEPLVPDARGHAVMAAHPHTVAFGIGAYASMPLLIDGQVTGAVCAASTRPTPLVETRDGATLRAVADHLGALLAGAPAPAHSVPPTVPAAGLETMTRPLLRLMQQITGLDGVYLTLYDEAADDLVVAHACDTADLGFAEGSSVPWRESMCRSAFSGGGVCVTDLTAPGEGNDLAHRTGISTWLSVPVLDHEHRMIGTLCGGSRAAHPVGEDTRSVAHTVAGLIADQLAREAAHYAEVHRTAHLQQRVDGLRDSLERDSLTGLANRAGIHRWLDAARAGLGEGDQVLMLAFLDLDGFKPINDTYGHGVGDEVLCGLGERLRSFGRDGDLRGRLGGDEFVVAAVLPSSADRPAWAARVREAAQVRVGDVRAAASVGVTVVTDPATTVEELLRCADQDMYRDKQHHGDPQVRAAVAVRAPAGLMGGPVAGSRSRAGAAPFPGAARRAGRPAVPGADLRPSAQAG